MALAYLACERHRPITRSELAEALWGEDLPASWEQMLRGIVFRLRGLLTEAGLEPTSTLTTVDGAHQLLLPPGVTVDVEEASAALEAARGALDAGYAGTARAEASRAVEIAAKEFAPGARGTWIERRQAELRETHLSALETLARAALGEADWSAAAAAAEEALSIEPFRESAYLALIEAQAGAGNRAEALQAYERCRRTLAEELGVDPSPRTEAVYLASLRDDGFAMAPTPATALPLPAGLVAVPGAFVVGREAEAEDLAMALKRAVVEGRQGVFVGGEPGVGKTCLVAMAARIACEGGARVLAGRCDEELGVPFQPFAQALEHYVAHCPLAELRAHVAAHGGIVSTIVPALTRRLPDATPPRTMGDAQADRWRLFQAVHAMLSGAAAEVPLVLVLDDLHWAATPTLLLLRHVLSEPTPMAVLIVGTYRHSDVGPDHPLAATLADLRRLPAVERLLLGGLDEDGVAAYLDAAGVVGNAGLARELQARTAGNPFFVGELVRHLSASAQRWSAEVPESVRDVVGRRVARLSEPARQALVVASVLGTEFEIDMVERLVPDPGSALDGVEECLSARLVHEVPATHGVHRFAHALVRDAVYRQLSGIRRARLHRQVGEVLEAKGLAEHAATLAYHFAEAAAAGCAAKAADYALAAAQQGADRAAWEDSFAILDRGLTALSADDHPDARRRFDLLVLKAQLRGMTAHLDLSELWKAGLEAFDAARAVGSPEALVRAAVAYNHPRRPSGQVGRQLCDEAFAALGDDPDPRLRALLLVSLLQTNTTDPADTEAMSEEALALARLAGDNETLNLARRRRASLLVASPHTASLAELAEEMRADPSSDFVWRSVGQRFAVPARLRMGDRAGFDAEVEELARLGEVLDSWLRRDQAATCRVTQALLDGRFSEVEPLITQLRGLHQEGGNPTRIVGMEAALCLEQGRFDDLEAISPPPMDSPHFLGAPLMHAVRAVAAAESGRREHARARLYALMPILPTLLPKGPLAAMTASRLADVALDVDETAVGAALAEYVRPYSGQVLVLGYGAQCLGPSDRALGILSALLGDDDAARAHFETALRIAEGLRSPPWVARTQFAFGRFLSSRAGATDACRAGELVSTAATTAHSLGMASLATRARALLAHVSAQSKEVVP